MLPTIRVAPWRVCTAPLKERSAPVALLLCGISARRSSEYRISETPSEIQHDAAAQRQQSGQRQDG